LYKGVYKDLFMTKISPTSSQLLNRENCLLVVIDVQEKLMPVIAKGVRVINNLVVLLKFARLTGLPVIVTEQQKLGATVAEVYAEASDIQPVFKWEFDCFACEEFCTRINQLGKNNLLICGVETHICIAQTALHALPAYNVQVISDATSSRFLPNWSVALERLRESGATITTTEMLIYELLKRADTEEFKATLPLIKQIQR